MTSDAAVAGAQLVWFTGSADLRASDHGGLLMGTAAEGEGAVVPVFIIDPQVHLRQPPFLVRRLHAALVSLGEELQMRHGCPLIVRQGTAAELLPKLADECGATVCHVVADDVCERPRAMMMAGCAALEQSGLQVQRWDNGLRATAYVADPTALPASFPEYVKAVSALPPQAPLLGEPEDGEMPVLLTPLDSEGVPSLAELLAAAEAVTPLGARAARSLAAQATLPPYEEAIVRWCAEGAARKALAAYVTDGKEAFADAQLSDALGGGSGVHVTGSLQAAAAQRLATGGGRPSDGLALREAATRAFSPALSLGVLSAREVLASEGLCLPPSLHPGARGGARGLHLASLACRSSVVGSFESGCAERLRRMAGVV